MKNSFSYFVAVAFIVAATFTSCSPKSQPVAAGAQSKTLKTGNPAKVVRSVEIPMQPFVIDHHGRDNAPVDVSFLLDAPAGRDGFITMENGHLVKPNGERFRIWGVNLTGWTRGSTLLPPKEEAAFWATAMARVGINCVRFHFLDLTTRTPEQEAQLGGRRRGPVGMVDGSRNDTQEFDADALDRLDYFVAELKKVGIYSNLNLNVGRTYKEGDNVPDNRLIRQAKGIMYVGERLIELQKDYALKLLTHYNPYTESKYSDEPAVATVEIVNENSLFEFWFRNWLRGELVPEGRANYELDFTPFYEKQLTDMYQDWLKNNRTSKELAQLRKLAGVEPDAPLPRTRRGDFKTAPTELFRAEADFYTYVETEFLMGMYNYIKKDLGVKSLVIGNADHTYWIPNQPMMRANGMLDFVDGHVYWQHPAIWGLRNTPMVNQPLASTIIKLSRSPFLNRPFTVSEVNHPNPNEYCAEMIPILASYGAFQDWDGIYFYTFEPKINNWQDYVADNFDITLDPIKMTQMSVGAMLFSRADVSAAKQTIARTYSAEQVTEAMRLPLTERPYFTPGFPLSLPLRHGSRIHSLDSKPTQAFDPDVQPPYISDTGELAWYVNDDGLNGLVTIDTPFSQALVGFVRDNDIRTSHIIPQIKNDFSVITLSSLTSDPIYRSDKMLLTACSSWQNTGSKWNDRRTLWETWGTGPTLIEPVVGWLVLQDLNGAVNVTVTPLDGACQPMGVPAGAKMVEDGHEITLDSPTTQYLITVAR